MMRSPVCLVLGVVLLATAAIAAAEEAPASRQGWEQRMLARMQQQLGLTDEQVTAIRTVQERYRDVRAQVFASLQQAQMQLRRLAVIGDDEAALEAKAAEIQSLIARSLQLRVRTLREVAPLLTPEQREKFARMGLSGHS
jgi:Spy/CpxP family protein refolding chaperone